MKATHAQRLGKKGHQNHSQPPPTPHRAQFWREAATIAAADDTDNVAVASIKGITFVTNASPPPTTTTTTIN